MNLAYPMMTDVPLPSPDILPRCSLSQKDKIMKAVEVNMRNKSAGAAGEEGAGDEAGVICFHGDRHPHTYAEMDNLLKVYFKIVFTVGNGNVLKGSLLNKTRTFAVFRNAEHEAFVMQELRRWLRERCADPGDPRFYVVPDAVDPPAPALVSAPVGAPGTPDGSQDGTPGSPRSPERLPEPASPLSASGQGSLYAEGNSVLGTV